MLAFVGGSPSLADRGESSRSILTALGAAVARAQARYRMRRRFHATRNALLQLDDRTLLDVTGLTRHQVRAMRGNPRDCSQLGLT